MAQAAKQFMYQYRSKYFWPSVISATDESYEFRPVRHIESPCWKAAPINKRKFLGEHPVDEGELFRIKFRELVRRWRNESQHLSSVKSAMALESYRQIVGMGQPAISLILLELKDRPYFWFGALRELTGEKEIGKNLTFKEAVAAWLKWGHDNNYFHERPS